MSKKRGRGVDATGRDKGRLPPFVPLLVATIDTPAWRAMTHGAKILYVALKRRASNDARNNGRIFLSQRDARQELRSGFEEITRWYRELQHYGFIVQARGGCLGTDGHGQAPHWRLTELGGRGVDGNPSPPTRDFERWNGERFKDSKTETRYGNPVHPATETRSTTATETRSASDGNRYGNPVHREADQPLRKPGAYLDNHLQASPARTGVCLEHEPQQPDQPTLERTAPRRAFAKHQLTPGPSSKRGEQ
jgi:hypothetical protein